MAVVELPPFWGWNHANRFNKACNQNDIATYPILQQAFLSSVVFSTMDLFGVQKKKHWRPWKGHKHRQGTRDSVALYQDQRNNQNRPRQKSSLRLSLELQDFPDKACGYVRLFWRINLIIVVMRWSNGSHSSKWQNKDMQWHSELRIPDCW